MASVTVSLNANMLSVPLPVRDNEGGILMCLLNDNHVHHLVAEQASCRLEKMNPHTVRPHFKCQSIFFSPRGEAASEFPCAVCHTL
jgi:hypothetical protein